LIIDYSNNKQITFHIDTKDVSLNQSPLHTTRRHRWCELWVSPATALFTNSSI